MAWWQAYAILIAIVTPVAAAVGFYRSRKLGYLVFLAQAALFLEIGAIVFAINPGPQPSMSPLLWFAAGVVLIDIFVMTWALAMRRRLLRGTITVAQLDRANDRAFISRLLTIAVVVAVLLNFEPWLGVVCLIANAAWLAIWIPRRLRTYGIEATADMSGPPELIFSYLVDPVKWPSYRTVSDRMIVSVKPEGPLETGSEMVSRMPVSIGKQLKPYIVESTIVVVDLVPNISYSTLWRDRPSEHATTRLETQRDGVRVSFALRGVQPFRASTLGVTFDVAKILDARKAELLRGWERLKAVLRSNEGQ